MLYQIKMEKNKDFEFEDSYNVDKNKAISYLLNNN